MLRRAWRWCLLAYRVGPTRASWVLDYERGERAA